MTRRPSIGLVTCAQHPALFGDEQALLGRLDEAGADARPLTWSDPTVEWQRFDAVVLRSTWDYFERIAEFRAWLDGIERSGARLFNPVPLVRWNFDKRYLAELEQRGVRIVPTCFVAPGEAVDLADCLRARDWREAVIKPAISGAAFRTHRFAAADAAALQPELDGIVASGGALVQPFMPAIVSEGEWSLVFFDGRLSHAVLKTPAAEDFRVQTQFGGQFRRVEPPPAMVRQATAIVGQLPVAPLYARIDGLRQGDELQLMEVEVIEPYLYFPAAPEAVATYVAAVMAAAAR